MSFVGALKHDKSAARHLAERPLMLPSTDIDLSQDECNMIMRLIRGKIPFDKKGHSKYWTITRYGTLEFMEAELHYHLIADMTASGPSRVHLIRSGVWHMDAWTMPNFAVTGPQIGQPLQRVCLNSGDVKQFRKDLVLMALVLPWEN